MEKSLYLAAQRGQAMRPCASLSPEYICCNVQVLDAVSNCPFRCSYCFLQGYLNDGRLKVVGDAGAILREVRQKIEAEPWRFFRIGTWELGDSLAVEPRTGAAAALVEAFASLSSAVLELKTKSEFVESLLGLDHGGRTVVAWSLNPQAVIGSEEHGTADLERRLAAMKRVAEAGYLVAAHFDPMILHAGWEQGYEDLARRVFRTIPPDRIAWISIGSLRFNPEMKKTIEDRFPASRITAAEMILGPDGKVRYVKPLRLALYRRMVDTIRRTDGDGHLVYLCMERWDVWKRIFGDHPRSIGHLDYLFAESLYRRYPGLVHQVPDRSLYDPQPNRDRNP